MKRIFTLFITICLILICGCDGKQESDIVSSIEAEDIVVYITKTGECYHKENCTCLSKSKIEKTLDEVFYDYRPCQICYPPTIEE